MPNQELPVERLGTFWGNIVEANRENMQVARAKQSPRACRTLSGMAAVAGGYYDQSLAERHRLMREDGIIRGLSHSVLAIVQETLPQSQQSTSA